MHKLLRSLEKEMAKARNYVDSSQWRQATSLFDGADGLLARFDAALDVSIKDGYLSSKFDPRKKSQSRLQLYAMACKAAVGASDLGKSKGGKWCDVTLEMDGENPDALVGKGERLLKEESWDEAVRTFERAFEATGRSSQDVGDPILRWLISDRRPDPESSAVVEGI